MTVRHKFQAASSVFAPTAMHLDGKFVILPIRDVTFGPATSSGDAGMTRAAVDLVVVLQIGAAAIVEHHPPGPERVQEGV